MSDSVAALLALAGPPEGEMRRDAQVLLCFILQRPRSYLYAWPEAIVDSAQAARYRTLLARRGKGEPVAYLTGIRDFWSLGLTVSDATLIPRPDTERLVELALELPLSRGARVLDLGTGSGAIALALATERRDWDITAVDVSASALTIARRNGEALGITNIRWLGGSWFAPLADRSFDLVLSNPPYLGVDDPHLLAGDLRFEPREALVAEGGALCAIDEILHQAPAHLAPGAWLLLEHGCEQGKAVRRRLAVAGLWAIETWHDAAGLDRVSGGHWPKEATC